jgi:branched-subunit amino acid transport protein
MRIWLVMLIGGLITFGMRFSFIFLFGKFHIPETVRKALCSTGGTFRNRLPRTAS